MDWTTHRQWLHHLLLQAEQAASRGELQAADGLLLDAQDRLDTMRGQLR